MRTFGDILDLSFVQKEPVEQCIDDKKDFYMKNMKKKQIEFGFLSSNLSASQKMKLIKLFFTSGLISKKFIA